MKKFKAYYSIDIEAEDILAAEEKAYELISELPETVTHFMEVTVREI